MISCASLINLSLILASQPTLKRKLSEDHESAPLSKELKTIESFDSLNSSLNHESDIVSPESQVSTHSGTNNLSDSVLNDTYFDIGLTGIDLDGIDLTGIDLTGIDLDDTNLDIGLNLNSNDIGFDPTELNALLSELDFLFQNDTDEFNPSSSSSPAKTSSLDDKQLASVNNDECTDFINQNPNVEDFSNEKTLAQDSVSCNLSSIEINEDDSILSLQKLCPEISEIFQKLSLFWLTAYQYLSNRKDLDIFFSSIKIKLDQYESLEEKKLEFIRIPKLIAEYCSLQNAFFIKYANDEALKMHPELSLSKSSMPNQITIYEINRALCQTFDIFNKSLEEIQTEMVMKQNELFTFLEIRSELIPKISGFLFFIFELATSISNFFTFPNDVPLFKLIVKDECLLSVEELNQLPGYSIFKVFFGLIDFFVTTAASPLLDKCIKSTDPQAIKEFSVPATRFLLTFFFSFMLKDKCPNVFDFETYNLFVKTIRQLVESNINILFKDGSNSIVEAFKSFFESLPKEGQAMTFNTASKASIKLLKELFKLINLFKV